MLFNKILVAFDGSNLSKKALEKAVYLVKEQASANHIPELEIIHAFHYPTVIGDSYAVDAKKAFLEGAQETLKKAKELVPEDIKAKYVLQNGDPSHTVLQYAENHQFDLIVMGSRGLGAIRELFLGSVSHNIVQQSKIPVLVIK
ncbi:universal stress protein [Paenibacillus rigui]|uniref:Universal stress protein UspA n=1 Tax=Paenibacillus rigui TaxID=554312 RepID=A0A229UWX9_9BACL|nr:universal stress protein [Paenibacillus rigui]OXM87890.1 universal stress protein UspA [Paenibacillus rigui]